MGGNSRYPGHWSMPPIRLGELRPEGIRVFVCCPICKRAGTLASDGIPLPDDADMGRVSRALHCTGCGRKGGISATPESVPWVQYLRRTGQRDRLPWNAAFIV